MVERGHGKKKNEHCLLVVMEAQEGLKIGACRPVVDALVSG